MSNFAGQIGLEKPCQEAAAVITPFRIPAFNLVGEPLCFQGTGGARLTKVIFTLLSQPRACAWKQGAVVFTMVSTSRFSRTSRAEKAGRLCMAGMLAS
jgi:hypothetical protein